MAGVSYTMATKIAIDTVSAQESLKGLNSALSSAVNSMKAGIAQANSVGDNLGAMKNKVEGLDQVMNQLQNKIDVLKGKQEGLDTSTKSGAESYLKLQKQIDQTENRLASYTAQQDRAKEKLGYYQSGLAELQHGYQMTIDKTEAYSNWLKAEGNDLEATKAKLSGYKEALSNLNQQYKKQSEELQNNELKVKELSASYSSAKSKLDEMTSAGQKNSNEYKEQENKVNDLKLALNRANDALDTQRIRVAKTGTSAAETKTKINSLSNEIKEVNPSPFQRLKNKITEAGDAGKKSESIFKGVFTANLGANAVIGLWTGIASHIGEATKAGMEFDKEQQKMLATWTTLTGNHKDAKIMVDDVNKLSVATGQSAQQTDELEQKFYHLHSSKEEAHDMTKAMLNMADAVGLNGQQIDAVSQDMTNALSRGKASAGEINQITQYFPMYREELAKSKNVTVQQLNEMVKQGKVSADDMEKVFEHLGNVKYGKAAENMLSTMTGAERTIKARMPQLIGDIEKPLMEAKNPFYLAVSKWASDPATDREFKKIGKATSEAINTITKAFGKNFKPDDLAKGMNGALDSIAKSITSFSKGVAAHSKEISAFFKTFKDTGVVSFKLFATETSILAKVLLPLLQFIADHQKVMVPLIAGMMAMSKASKLMNLALMPIGITARTISGPLKGVRSLLTGLVGNKVSKEASLITKSFNLMGRGINKAFTLAAKGLLKGAQAFTSFSKSAAKMALSVGKSMGKMALSVAKAMGKMALSMATNPFGLAIIGITLLVTAVTLAYKKIKPFRDFVNGLAKSIGQAFGKVANTVGNALKPLGGIFKQEFKYIEDIFGFWIDVFTGKWGRLGKDLGRITQDGWNVIKSIFKVSYDWLNGLTGGWLGKTINFFVDTFKSIINFLKGSWDTIKDVWKSSTDWIGNVWNGFLSSVKWIWDHTFGALIDTAVNCWNTIKNAWKSANDWIHDVWNDFIEALKWMWDNSLLKRLIDMASGMWDNMKNMFKTSLDWISSTWNNSWGAVRDFFGDIWNDIKGKAQDGINWVIGVLNGGIDEINKIIHTFGGSEHTIKNISQVKLAGGTLDDGGLNDLVKNGRLTRHTMVTLNDGNDSPETGNKEMAILPNGKAFIPQQRNWQGVLPAGSAVMKASDTRRFMAAHGVAKFADGTFDWLGGIADVAGDVWGSIKDFGSDMAQGLDTAMKIVSDPMKYIKDLIKTPKKWGSEIVEDFGSGLWDKAKDGAFDFWNGVWQSVGDILGNSAASGSQGDFLKYAEKNLAGRAYELGGFDCSEMVKEALAHFGINAGRTTVAQEHSGKLSKISKKDAKPGDLVYFGTSGADAHVGIVSDPVKGLMFNQHPPKGGISTIKHAEDIDGPARYYHVKGFSTDDGDKKDKKDASSGAIKAAHSMLDNTMFKWIKDHLAPLVDDGDDDDLGGDAGPAPKGDHKNWMKQAGIPESWMSAVNEIVTKESSWNPHARNGKYYGLPQTTVDNLKKAGSDWKDNPITQLRAMKKYIKERYGTAANALSFRHAHNWYANGGYVASEQLVHVAEGNKGEFIIPTDPARRPRAEQLLGQAVNQFANDGASNFSQPESNKELKKEVEELKGMVKELVSLQIQTIKSQDGTTKAVYDTAQDPRQRYINDARNGQSRDYQIRGKYNAGY